MGDDKKKKISYILGKSILFASMQFAIGSVEMSSKFSVKNFSTAQEVLDNAVIALRDYLIVGCLWMIGTCLIFYTNYGVKGFLINVGTNMMIMYWIYASYLHAFQSAAQQNNLVIRPVFS
jgi:hypothetical protein